jgi:hypothetical protein
VTSLPGPSRFSEHDIQFFMGYVTSISRKDTSDSALENPRWVEIISVIFSENSWSMSGVCESERNGSVCAEECAAW